MFQNRLQKLWNQSLTAEGAGAESLPLQGIWKQSLLWAERESAKTQQVIHIHHRAAFWVWPNRWCGLASQAELHMDQELLFWNIIFQKTKISSLLMLWKRSVLNFYHNFIANMRFCQFHEHLWWIFSRVANLSFKDWRAIALSIRFFFPWSSGISSSISLLNRKLGLHTYVWWSWFEPNFHC